MLLVGDRIQNEDALGNHKSFNIDDFIWQHGVTPPLHHVRKRRFRKRVNKRTIESVEQEVERLLAHGATQVADHRGQYGPGTGWVILADPEGNEFCVLRTEAEAAANPNQHPD